MKPERRMLPPKKNPRDDEGRLELVPNPLETGLDEVVENEVVYGRTIRPRLLKGDVADVPSREDPNIVDAEIIEDEESAVELAVRVPDSENLPAVRMSGAVAQYVEDAVTQGEAANSNREKISKSGIAKAVGKMMLGVGGSLLGVKSLVDVPRWLKSKYDMKKSSPVLMKAFEDAVDERFRLSHGEIADNEREARLQGIADKMRAKIDQTRGITAEKKQALEGEVERILNSYNITRQKGFDEAHDDFARVIDKALESKVKGSTAIKEGLNSILMVSGLSMLRSAAYGGVALYERHQRVQAEMGEGKRAEGYTKEMFVNGFKETWTALRGKEGKTKTERGLNVVKAVGIVARFAGFSSIAAQELMDEGVTGSIDKMLDQWEEKTADDFAKDNFVENIHRLTFGAFEDKVTPEFPEAIMPTNVPDDLPVGPDAFPAVPRGPGFEHGGPEPLDVQPGGPRLERLSQVPLDADPDIDPNADLGADPNADLGSDPGYDSFRDVHPVPEAYTIKGGEGPLHAIRHLHDDPEVQEQIVASMRSTHPEWDNLSDKRILIKWRLLQLKELGGRLTQDGEVFSMTVHEGAQFSLEWDDDGMAHVAPVSEDGVSVHEPRAKVYEQTPEVVEAAEVPVEQPAMAAQFQYNADGSVAGLMMDNPEGAFSLIRDRTIHDIRDRLGYHYDADQDVLLDEAGAEVSQSDLAQHMRVADQVAQNHYMLAALDKSMMGDGREAEFIRKSMKELLESNPALFEGVSIDQMEASALGVADSIDVHDTFGPMGGADRELNFEITPHVDEVLTPPTDAEAASDSGWLDIPELSGDHPVESYEVDMGEDAELEPVSAAEITPDAEPVNRVVLANRGEARFIRDRGDGHIVALRQNIDGDSFDKPGVRRGLEKLAMHGNIGEPKHELPLREMYGKIETLRAMNAQGFGYSEEATWLRKDIEQYMFDVEFNNQDGDGVFDQRAITNVIDARP